ncbi:MAG: SDR family oxidoreductase [Novosphingobium sp.]|nr:SDR family oxidoreductase [Novosphingobium sp.]
MADRPVALITGACGGMGQACARLIGRTHVLALSDIDEGRLRTLEQALTAEGHTVAAIHAGDYTCRGTPTAAVQAARGAGPLEALVHTAGLSPIQTTWDRILVTNTVATAELLDAVAAGEGGPPNAVLIASIAGHAGLAMPHAQLDALLDAPLRDDLLTLAEPLLRAASDPALPLGMEMASYQYSKSAVIRAAERRAKAWGRLGRRINTISPGVTRTPMGVAEMEGNPVAKATADGAPLGVASPVGIANAVEFLLSPLAASITGTDLRIDGGLMPASRYP